MVNHANILTRELDMEILPTLKRGVLELALSKLTIDKRKIKVLNKIISKVVYTGEVKECKEKEQEIKQLN